MTLAHSIAAGGRTAISAFVKLIVEQPRCEQALTEFAISVASYGGPEVFRRYGLLWSMKGANMTFWKRWLSVFLGAILLSALADAPAAAQERTAVRHDLAFPADGSARIIVYRPDVMVGERSTGGLFEPNADWTLQARGHIDAALRERLPTLGSTIVTIDEPVGPQAQLMSEYSALFSAVSQSIITYQFFVGNRLETKKRDNREGVFDWSLGEGVRSLPGADRADYALFIITEDHYGSTGRRILQIFAAAAVGVPVSVGLHAGYAGLVDLQTGNIVWINADFAMGGDVREAEGARRRVAQLLEGFPGASGAGTTAGAGQ